MGILTLEQKLLVWLLCAVWMVEGRTSSIDYGSVYVRWGRTTCRHSSELLYKGFAAGAHYTHGGGGVNYLCLPLTPEWHISGTAGYSSFIYGAEYETANHNAFPAGTQNQNVPCARCVTRGRPTVMMIPAKRTCPSGWTKEYEGYLMTGYHGHAHPSTYECVDQQPEYVIGQTANTDGALFYFVKSPDCNKLAHCPPYTTNREFTCVVCSI